PHRARSRRPHARRVAALRGRRRDRHRYDGEADRRRGERGPGDREDEGLGAGSSPWPRALLAVLVVFRRRRVELPAVPIALRHLVGRAELFVVLIFHADGAADVVHHVLVGRRVVAPRGLVAGEIRTLEVGVGVATGQLGRQ